MATRTKVKTKKGERPVAGNSQLKRLKATALVRAKRAKAKQPKRAKTKQPKRVAEVPSTSPLRARPTAAAKSAYEPVFQRRRVVVRFHEGFDEERERKELTELYGRIGFHPVIIFARTLRRFFSVLGVSCSFFTNMSHSEPLGARGASMTL